MTQVRFTSQAREDLLEIWVYVTTHSSETIADRVYDAIERSCRRLSDHPQVGRVRPEIHQQARSLVVERWLVLYRAVEDGVEIVRIIDGARDLTAIDWAHD